MEEKINILFFGSPEFSIPALKILLASNRIKVCGVVTQPEKIRGRGKGLASTPVGTLANSLSIPVFSPTSLKGILGTNHIEGTDEFKLKEYLINHSFDFFILVAYGKLIPEELLKLPKKSFLNIHPSKLPYLRGAAPIQHTLINGEEETEVCIIELVKELDAGPIYNKQLVKVLEEDNYGTLSIKLGEIGGELLIKTIYSIYDGSLIPTEQENLGTTYATKIKKEDTIIDWNLDARKIFNQIRGLSPEPCARTSFNNKICKIISSSLVNHEVDFDREKLLSGSIIIDDKNKKILVKCGDNKLISIEELQIEGKNIILAREFINGIKNLKNIIFI